MSEPCFVVALDERPLTVEWDRDEWAVRYRAREWRGTALVQVLERAFAGHGRRARDLALQALIREAQIANPGDDPLGRDPG